ncbi:DeoR/GlpR family transcriptional regulator of sugar metabolism [Psychromicrobium silvestre]|uniref:DeoR/GlpR family transcriptional regulator of sugar metabolism n=1 Tax=Psychromicrobium silvestre TaxID=1645614 RepID=A0A7Y9S7A5_9MICC|nr:DeoR/GlpR family DNA-binding transcription regulator [Psychromicrobium silvestre]NYE95958.1 DeoR/GlpR family transcriptional regulator of sugar metabolism [Psychromicrobium silvestre]
MSSDERHRRITDLLRVQARVEVEELAGLCGTSAATIRRDLDALEQRGVLRRVHGGANSLIMGGHDPGYPQRALESQRSKIRIAFAVAGLLKPHEFVFLDSGSTATQIAVALKQQSVTVMPDSLHAARELAGGRAEVIMPGGNLVEEELALRGPLAEANIRSLRFDTAIITPCTFDLKTGIMGHDLADAAIKRAAMASAHRVIIACHAEKWNRPSPVVVSSAEAADLLITDHLLSAEETALAQTAQLEVKSL